MKMKSFILLVAMIGFVVCDSLMRKNTKKRIEETAAEEYRSIRRDLSQATKKIASMQDDITKLKALMVKNYVRLQDCHLYNAGDNEEIEVDLDHVPEFMKAVYIDKVDEAFNKYFKGEFSTLLHSEKED